MSSKRMDRQQQDDYDRLRAEHQAIRYFRDPEEPLWRSIIDIAYPDGTPPQARASDSVTTVRGEIYDNTAEDAGEMASSAFQAMTTNPSTRWLELGLFDQRIARDTDAGSWLWDTSSRLLRCFRHPSTLFSLAMDEDNLQLIHLGNSCLHVEDRPGKLPLYRACDMAHIWWDENADGIIDRVFREFELTALAAYLKWGKDRLPDAICEAATQPATAHKLYTFLHVNRPVDARDRERGLRSNMPYRSVYLCIEAPWIVEDGGSHELEYICSRWRRRAGKRYGRGCGHRALSDNGILQRMNRTVLLAGERTIDPPLLVPEDEDQGPISLKARALNRVRPDYLSSGAHPRAMITNTRVDIGLDLIVDRRELVRRSYLKQLIELVRDPKYTATQWLGLQAEQQRGMVPVLTRHETERLGPIVARTYNTLRRMPGVILPAPESLRGAPLQASFDSPDAKAMRLGVARNLSQGLELMAPSIEATKDDAAWDNFDLDEAWRTQAEGFGFPSATLRPVDVRDRMREQRLQVAREKDQLEAGKDVTTMFKNSAPLVAALSQFAKSGGGAAAPEGAAA